MAFNKAKALLEAQKYVSQGKNSQAIKQYLQIVEKDPTDLILLNTVGDLYIRDKNFSEGMKQFYKLADAYMKDGFIVKAIAIYKKISKLEPGSIEPILKLGELYLTQGLNREAREQYTAALEIFKRKKQQEKALEVVRKIAQLDPDNPRARLQLAEFAEEAGNKPEAAQAYLEAATIAQRVEDTGTAEKSLKKASQLDPANPQVQLFLARQAHRRKDLAEVEKIITAAPGLRDNPAARRLLLECYLASKKLDAAETLLVEVFHSNPSDFTPIASFADQCLAKRDFDAAYKAVNAVADELVAQKNTEPLMETLRKIWSQAPEHLETLELIYKVSEKTADELTIPEVLEALGHSYVQKERLDKAEAVYRKMVSREPENEHYKGLLKQVLQKEGKEYVPANAAALSDSGMALETPAEEGTAQNAEEAAMVKETIDNADLFIRYNLTEKAVREFEKALEIYPDQIDIHKRIVEACRKNLPERGAVAADALVRIFSGQGDGASAHRYQEIARQLRDRASTFQPAENEPAAAEPAPPAAAPSAEIDLSQEFAFSETRQEAAPEPVEIPLDLTQEATRPPAEEAQPAEPAAAEAPPAEPAPASPVELPSPLEAGVPPFNEEESSEEVNFYLSQGLEQEARKSVEDMEIRYPGNRKVARLRELVEDSIRAKKETVEKAETGPPVEESAPAPSVVEQPAEPKAAPKEWELPSSFAGAPPAAAPAAEETAAPAAGADLLGSLAGDLASGLENIQAPDSGKAPAVDSQGAQAAGASGTQGLASELSGLLDELGEAEPAQAAGDDPETHYNLGVAFREMGLLDEAIGEFQKVAKGTTKGVLPANFLQACTLLAVCFTDKGMPAIAAKWYLRALETPNLEEEALLALHYDLGAAYEQAGDTKNALQKFTEVYSQNIDYRDVAEKIRLLQQKAS